MKDTDMATGDNSFDDALVAAENLLVNALDLGERDVDLIGLFQNAMATIRNNPEATFNQVIADHYTESAETVRGWWSRWSARVT
jgi:hypothetical protein